MPRTAADLAPADRVFLRHLQTLALRYFLDNQTADSIFLDRQSNHGLRRFTGLRSTSASGMGLIAVAVGSGVSSRHRVARTGTAVVRPN
jgi:hypothetical protein